MSSDSGSGAPPVPSAAALARVFGVSKMAVSKWTADPRWPREIPRVGPWTSIQVREIARWREATLAPQPGSHDEKALRAEMSDLSLAAKAKVRLDLARAAKVELEKEILAGLYVKREEVEEQWTRRVTAVRTALQALPRAVASVLAGRPAAEVERELEDRLRRLCEDFARGRL